MMRTEFLPERQNELNLRLRKRLRALMVSAVCVLLMTVVGFAALLLTGTSGPELPRLISSDGHTEIGWAIPVTPTLVLAEGQPTEGVQLSLHVSDRTPLTIVRTVSLPYGGKLTLFRAPEPIADALLPVISSAENNQRATAFGPGPATWEGTLTEKAAPLFEPNPTISLPTGLAVYSAADKSLVGMIVQSRDGVSVVSMMSIMAVFPEIKSGQ